MTDVQFEKGSTATPYEPYFDPYVLTTTGIGSWVAKTDGEIISGYLSGSNSTFVKYNTNASGTCYIAQLKPYTNYMFTAQPFTGANRSRLVLLDSDPRDGLEHAVGTFNMILWQSSFSSEVAQSFYSEGYKWLIFGASDTSAAYNPNMDVELLE